MKILLINLSLFLLVFVNDKAYFESPMSGGECTIGVFSGNATADGRPLLWKNRDVTRPIQKFCFYEPMPGNDSSLYAFIGNVYSSDTTRVYMGQNEVGFAIMNSNSYNLNDSLADGLDDGVLLRMALERCRTMEDFEEFLEYTAIKGRQDGWNIGIYDADGNAALYECGNRTHVKFDANDPDDAPEGYILRATFGLSGSQNNRIGFERYKRACRLTEGRQNETPISAKFIFQTLSRDLANLYDNPYPLPYNGRQNGRPDGFIYTRNLTINRDVTRSVMVLRGVAPGEDPRLATTFNMIGPPVLSIAFPLWVYSMDIPEVFNIGDETPMYSLMVTHRNRLYPIGKDPHYLDSHYLHDNNGNGILTQTIPIENTAFEMTKNYIDSWNIDMPTPAQMKAAQDEIAEYVYSNYQELDNHNPENNQIAKIVPEKFATVSCYPNPFNARATIQLEGFSGEAPVSVEVYDLLGRRVKSIDSNNNNRMHSFVVWDGTDDFGNQVSSGVYLVRAFNIDRLASTKIMLMK